MHKFNFLLKEIWKGNSVTRAFLNFRLKEEVLRGKTIDIGGGRNSNYISFLKKEDNVEFLNFDVKAGVQIDFEYDKLPVSDNFYDTVLFLNVMEHIFNYQHIANEVVRITKPEGQLIGFVPFLMWYHPDHKDFFRYTHEALEKIFKKSGAAIINIESLSSGPFIASAQMIVLSLPRILGVTVFIFSYIMDLLYLRLSPKNRGRFSLGYFFIIKK